MSKYEQYVKILEKRGYRVKENLVFLTTPSGLWIQQIEEDDYGIGLVTVYGPAEKNPVFKLNEYGVKQVETYIRELKAKRKEILDAGKDTAEDTTIPTVEEIEEDINFTGMDSDGEYVNGWGVTDHYDADYPILLKIGRDFCVA